MEIPAELKLTKRQREGIERLDIANRYALIKQLLAEQRVAEKVEEQVSKGNDKTKSNGVINKVKSYVIQNYPSIKRANNEANRIKSLNISDENKHQYVSCLGAQGGGISAALTLLGAVEKECEDLYRKTTSSVERKKYEGVVNIWNDSVKDMKNNLYGAGYGLTYRKDGDCDILLKHKIR